MDSLGPETVHLYAKDVAEIQKYVFSNLVLPPLKIGHLMNYFLQSACGAIIFKGYYFLHFFCKHAISFTKGIFFK